MPKKIWGPIQVHSDNRFLMTSNGKPFSGWMILHGNCFIEDEKEAPETSYSYGKWIGKRYQDHKILSGYSAENEIHEMIPKTSKSGIKWPKEFWNLKIRKALP